jgi:hypothetical protein
LGRRKLTQRCQIGQKKAYTEMSDRSEESLHRDFRLGRRKLKRRFQIGQRKLTQKFQIGQKKACKEISDRAEESLHRDVR